MGIVIAFVDKLSKVHVFVIVYSSTFNHLSALFSKSSTANSCLESYNISPSLTGGCGEA